MALTQLSRAIGGHLEGRVQSHVAREAGITPQVLSDWKSGRRTPAPDDLLGLERALDLEPGGLTRHLGWIPVDPHADRLIEVASEATQTVRYELGASIEEVEELVGDFDAFALSTVRQALSVAAWTRYVDHLEEEFGPIPEEAHAWAEAELDRVFGPEGTP